MNLPDIRIPLDHPLLRQLAQRHEHAFNSAVYDDYVADEESRCEYEAATDGVWEALDLLMDAVKAAVPNTDYTEYYYPRPEELWQGPLDGEWHEEVTG